MSNNDNNHVLSHHLIGLSQTYWSYNPLLISSIHENILVINGIDVFVILDEDDDHRGDGNDHPPYEPSSKKRKYYPNSSSSSSTPITSYKAKHVIPMNKCLLVGIIQYVQYKSNGSITFVIDDGTGLIDCIHWVDNDDFDNDDDLDGNVIEAIRSMDTKSNTKISFDDVASLSMSSSRKYQVGDVVSIHGQIRNLSIDHHRKVLLQIPSDSVDDSSTNTTATSDKNASNTTQENNLDMNESNCTSTTTTTSTSKCTNTTPELLWEGYFCSREIQIKHIQKITNVNEETVHWLKSLQFIKRIQSTTHIRSLQQEEEQEKEQPLNESGDVKCNNKKPRHPKGTGLLGHVKEVDNNYITNEEFCLYKDGWNIRQQSSIVNLPVLDGLDIYNVISNEIKNEIMMRPSPPPHNDYDATTTTTTAAGYEGIATTKTSNGSIMNTNTMKIIKEDSNAIIIDPKEKVLRNYFGRHCPCRFHRRNNYTDELLYCHCIATKESLDQEWKFRDALLSKLLQMESIFCGLSKRRKKSGYNSSSSSSNSYSSSNNNSNDKSDTETNKVNNNDKDNRKQTSIDYFQFKFSTIFSNEELQSIAKEVVSKSSSSLSSSSSSSSSSSTTTTCKSTSTSTTTIQSNIRHLFTNTFHQLRKDGILYLLDLDQDIYVLLSKTQVLLPIVKRMIVQEEQYKFCQQIRSNSSSSSSRYEVDGVGGVLSTATNNDAISNISLLFIKKVSDRKLNLLKRLVHIERNGHCNGSNNGGT